MKWSYNSFPCWRERNQVLASMMTPDGKNLIQNRQIFTFIMLVKKGKQNTHFKN